MAKTYTIAEAWRNACEEEGIPEDTKLVVFSDDNQWAKRYNKAMSLYFAAKREGKYTMERKEYSGWTNYETWVTKLWLDNDEGSQELQRTMAGQAKQTPKVDVWTREETNKFTLADMLKDFVEDANPMASDASMYSDLLRSAISEIDWQEIAESILLWETVS